MVNKRAKLNLVIKPKKQSSPLIYQLESGEIKFKFDQKNQTILANINQIAELFGVKKPAISKHLKNIFRDGELEEKSVVSILETTAKDGKNYKVHHFHLDAIIAVGYRVNSKEATKFRIWSSNIIRSYILEGFSINKKVIVKNYNSFIEAINKISEIVPNKKEINANSVIELIKNFAQTWVSLDAYDKNELKIEKLTKKTILLSAKELQDGINELKNDLIKKGEATEIFAKEKTSKSIESIIGNIMQSFDGKDLYPSLEEKASNLFYFVVKDHPFIDGNKRSGSFSFIWFLQKYKVI